MLGLDAFIGLLAAVTREEDPPPLQDVTEMVRGLSLTGTFADDVSLVEVILG